MPKELALNWAGTVGIPELMINLCVGLALSILLRWHYQRFGSTLSNKSELSNVFPLVLMTTVLIITVVKSSLALSLGLVGALSIVRFRTPIKEPEELAYLFITIAMGLGLGANQTLVTVLSGVLILTFIAIIKHKHFKQGTKNFYLSIELDSIVGKTKEGQLEYFNNIITKHADKCDLRRFAIQDDGLEATYFIDVKNSEMLNSILEELRENTPGVSVTFLDQKQLAGI